MTNSILMSLMLMAIITVGVLVSTIVLVFAERKVMAYMQDRVGPNRVGPLGTLQLIADVIKLLHKEIIVPKPASWGLYLWAPVLSTITALGVWSVIPLDEGWVVANIDAGVLFVFAMTSLGAYGILLAGWASHSKYAFFAAIRSMAQVIAYEIAMGFALVGVLMAAGSMNLTVIVQAQAGTSILGWYAWPLFPLLVVYWIAAVAETNRSPFDVVEGESEIVAGHHVEYSGFAFALFFLAEYVNMMVVSVLAALLFFGGWLSPFAGLGWLDYITAWVPGSVWLIGKMSLFLFVYLWIRATFPRYRYDQIMMLGWKVLIPVTLCWIVVEGIMIKGGLL